MRPYSKSLLHYTTVECYTVKFPINIPPNSRSLPIALFSIQRLLLESNKLSNTLAR